MAGILRDFEGSRETGEVLLRGPRALAQDLLALADLLEKVEELKSRGIHLASLRTLNPGSGPADGRSHVGPTVTMIAGRHR